MKKNDFGSFVTNRRLRPLLCFCTYPFTCAVFILSCLAYGILFGTLFTLTAGLLTLLIAGITVGAVLSLTGIVYGIRLLSSASSAAPGLYELGLGFTLGGASLLFTLIASFSIRRVVPFLLGSLRWLFLFCYGRQKLLLTEAKEVIGVR